METIGHPPQGLDRGGPPTGQSTRPPLLRPGETCWRRAVAHRAAMLVDMAAYLKAAEAAMLQARHSILLLGWGFDARLSLDPSADGTAREGAGASGLPRRIGPFLEALSRRRPRLDIRLLIWDMAPPIALANALFPQRALLWFRGGRVTFHLDTAIPYGACHHQKVLVVDGAVAFCGGGDFMADRWDTEAHADDDPRRRLPGGWRFGPRHEVMMMVDGPAAAALDTLARERWRAATGETLAPPPPGETDPWPAAVAPGLAGVEFGIARTAPDRPGAPGIRENEALFAAAILVAERLIYMENQYVTAPLIEALLARRLAEPGGPEIVIVTSGRSPSYFDRMTMDAPRDALIPRLRAADRHGRLRIFAPRTARGRTICIHSKVTIIDDRLLRVGSTNLNNRSLGYDTECDLAVEAEGPRAGATAAAIARFRDHLVGHFLGVEAATVARAQTAQGGLIAAIAAIDPAQRRLAPIRPRRRTPLARLVTTFQIGDPYGTEDAWRPWRRRRPAVAI